MARVRGFGRAAAATWRRTCGSCASCCATRASKGVTYGHYGEGCIHLRVGFGLDKPGGKERYERFMHAAADLVASHGGTISGEHGDGLARSALLEKMYPPEMIDLFGRFKDLWDPEGVLNPGIIVRPPPVTVDLRAVRPVTLTTAADLAFAHDGGSFRAAVDRCIGVGRLRVHPGTGADVPLVPSHGR